jgi:hypothetical protein
MKQAAIGPLFLSLLLPLALAGCGRGGDQSDAFAETVAKTFEADCLRIAATQQRQQLCTCSAQWIRTSGIKAGDGDQANDEKIHAAQRACRQQVLGKDA